MAYQSGGRLVNADHIRGTNPGQERLDLIDGHHQQRRNCDLTIHLAESPEILEPPCIDDEKLLIYSE
jgi:hypothetical protein